jgi:hypothetical protein
MISAPPARRLTSVFIAILIVLLIGILMGTFK